MGDNKDKIAKTSTEWGRLLASVLKRGFFGSAKLTAQIEDGKITTIRTAEEQTHK